MRPLQPLPASGGGPRPDLGRREEVRPAAGVLLLGRQVRQRHTLPGTHSHKAFRRHYDFRVAVRVGWMYGKST